MTDKQALQIDGTVDEIRRLQREPPSQYDKTAWAIDDVDGVTLLIECAVIPCPSCGEAAFWNGGYVACADCRTRQRLVG